MGNYYQAKFTVQGHHLRRSLEVGIHGPVGVHSIPQRPYRAILDVDSNGETATALFPQIYTDASGNNEYVWILSVLDSATNAVLLREKVIQPKDLKESEFLPPEPENPLSVGIAGMREDLDYFAGQTATMVSQIGEAFKEQVTESTTNITTAIATNASTVSAAIHSSSREIGEDERRRAYADNSFAESLARIAEGIATTAAVTEALGHRLTAMELFLSEMRVENQDISTRQEMAEETLERIAKQPKKKE